jgi:hypothetical protein
MYLAFFFLSSFTLSLIIKPRNGGEEEEIGEPNLNNRLVWHTKAKTPNNAPAELFLLRSNSLSLLLAFDLKVKLEPINLLPIAVGTKTSHSCCCCLRF